MSFFILDELQDASQDKLKMLVQVHPSPTMRSKKKDIFYFFREVIRSKGRNYNTQKLEFVGYTVQDEVKMSHLLLTRTKSFSNEKRNLI